MTAPALTALALLTLLLPLSAWLTWRGERRATEWANRTHEPMEGEL